MRKPFAAAALIVTCLASGAHAASWDTPPPPWEVPQPHIIPLPGMIEPHYEVGARYWWSEGKTKFSINASRLDPALNIPTSTLTYDDVQGNTAEFVFRARNEGNFFAKGFVGGGFLNGGTLDGSGSFAGQGKFSVTDTALGGNNLAYGTLDIGKRFTLREGAAKVSFSPFIGFNLWQEGIEADGALCKPDANCGPGGSTNVLFKTNEAGWAALRLGSELQVKLFDRFTLIGDGAILPIAYLVDDEGANIQNSGAGWGYQLEAALRVDLTPCWSLGSGVRYWFAEVKDGSSKFGHPGATAELSDFTSQRFGVFGDFSYRF
jgi:hypothetical protein